MDQAQLFQKIAVEAAAQYLGHQTSNVVPQAKVKWIVEGAWELAGAILNFESARFKAELEQAHKRATRP